MIVAVALADIRKRRSWGYNEYGQAGVGSTEVVGATSAQLGDNMAAVNIPGRKALSISLGKRCTWTSSSACKSTSPHACPAVRVLAMSIPAVPVCRDTRNDLWYSGCARHVHADGQKCSAQVRGVLEPQLWHAPRTSPCSCSSACARHVRSSSTYLCVSYFCVHCRE